MIEVVAICIMFGILIIRETFLSQRINELSEMTNVLSLVNEKLINEIEEIKERQTEDMKEYTDLTKSLSNLIRDDFQKNVRRTIENEKNIESIKRILKEKNEL